MLLYIRHPSDPSGDTGHLGHYKNNWTDIGCSQRGVHVDFGPVRFPIYGALACIFNHRSIALGFSDFHL